MGNIGVTEVVVVLVILVVLFGGTRLPQLGKGLGEGIRNFKDSIKSAQGKGTEEESK